MLVNLIPCILMIMFYLLSRAVKIVAKCGPVGWSKNTKIEIFQRHVVLFVHLVQETHSAKYGEDLTTFTGRSMQSKF